MNLLKVGKSRNLAQSIEITFKNFKDRLLPSPVNIFGFSKRLIGNVLQRLKNDGYKNHL